MRLDLAYDGTGFHGWARQRGVRTVQGVLEEALGRVAGAPVSLSVAGRTDAGVHAAGQVASFRAPASVEPATIRRAVNAMLGPEVQIRSVRRVAEGFDARHSATAREYRYRIDTAEAADPFTARYVWHRPGRLRIGAMRAAARHLTGTHDFASFCRRPPEPGGSTVRRLERLTVSSSGEVVDVRARGNAFCHQMVRSLVGTLVAVGEGRIAAQDIPAVLAARDRAAAGRVAPPQGLTLLRVSYGRPSGTGALTPARTRR